MLVLVFISAFQSFSISVFRSREHAHNVGGGPAGSQELGHLLHIGVNVPHEMLVSLAEPIQAWFAISCLQEPMFRAFSMAGKEECAVAALIG